MGKFLSKACALYLRAQHFLLLRCRKAYGVWAGCLYLIVSASFAQGAAEVPARLFPPHLTEPTLMVTGGQIQGRYLPLPGGAIFKGIPYAAPPVGNLRWREPQAVTPWKATLETDRYGPACPLLPVDGNVMVAATSSEDCLFLNVWTPRWPLRGGSKLPVMMYIHGGELMGNSGEGGLNIANLGVQPKFDGTALARHGVVVVTINYRTGILGMIGHPELTAESAHHNSGNYAMLDQIAALHWIHDNIAQFGGDPGNVTVFGQSGGARFTDLLVGSPLTRGLMHRAIMESFARRPYLTQAQLEKLGTVLAQVLKAPATGQIAYMRSLPTSQILAAGEELRKRLAALPLALDEGIDGHAVPTNPGELYRSRKEAPIPLIVGNASLDASVGGVVGKLGMKPDSAAIQTYIKAATSGFYAGYPDLIAKAQQAYGVSTGPNDVSTDPSYGTAEKQLAVDLGHRCEDLTKATYHSAIAPTFHYEFTRATPGHPPLHESELRYLFGYLANEQADPAARKLADQMESYWANFAKNGDPNGPGLPVWQKFDPKGRHSMQFTNSGPVPTIGLRAQACGVYAEKFARDPEPLLGGEAKPVKSY